MYLKMAIRFCHFADSTAPIASGLVVYGDDVNNTLTTEGCIEKTMILRTLTKDWGIITNGFTNKMTVRDCYFSGNTLTKLIYTYQGNGAITTFVQCHFDQGVTITDSAAVIQGCWYDGATTVLFLDGLCNSAARPTRVFLRFLAFVEAIVVEE